MTSPGIDFCWCQLDIKSFARTQCRVASIFLNNNVNVSAAPAAVTTSPETREQHGSVVVSLWSILGCLAAETIEIDPNETFPVAFPI
jgi:hypothetical protein